MKGKIQMNTPQVGKDGDEKTRFLWKAKLHFIITVFLFQGFLVSCSNDEETSMSSISVHYCLEDNNGKEKTSFNYGEPIVFKLTIKNNTKKEIKFNDEKEFILSSFLVYNSDGEYINYAAISTDEMMRSISIKPKETFQKRQLWERTPLPKGDYYSRLIIKEGETTKEYPTFFKIQ